MPGIVSYPADCVITKQGELDGDFYVIIKGTVEVIKTTSQGKALRLRLLGNGAHFGEISLLREIPRTATVRTLTPCECYTFSRTELLTLLQGVPQLCECLEVEIPLLLRASKDQCVKEML